MAIKSMELEPTRENLLNTLTKDLLDRNKSVWHFARFCDAQEGKCSIAIDAKWGAGKTFFVRHVQLLMDSFNQFTESMTREERASIQSTFFQHIRQCEDDPAIGPEVCVYYDAWANDNDEDPVLSLVYEIVKGAAQHYKFTKGLDWLKTAAAITDFFTGKNAAEIVDLAKENDPLSKLRAQKEIHSLVADFLESLLYEKGNRLIIFIDELDRCKPVYAVRLLERIKHYFSNDRITFVFSVNLDELQHAVKSHYGEGFDACRYLDRFFDYRITLPPANKAKYYLEIGLDNGTWVYESVCREVIDYCGFELRETEKFYRMAKIAAYRPTHDSRVVGFFDGGTMQFALLIIVPIMIGLRMRDIDQYNAFVEGRDSKPLIDIMGDGDIAQGLCNALLDNGETYSEPREQEVKVLLSDKLHAAYLALFGAHKSGYRKEDHIGKYTFDSHIKDEVLKAASMLSDYATYGLQ